MAFKLTPPLEKEFVLEEIDQIYGSEGTSVTIRQASQAQHEKRTEIFSRMMSRVSDNGSVEISQKFNASELARVEARLTMVECNIMDETGDPLFKFKKDSNGRSYLSMSDSAFDNAWGKLPVDVTKAIHDRVIEVNVSWNPAGEES